MELYTWYLCPFGFLGSGIQLSASGSYRRRLEYRAAFFKCSGYSISLFVRYFHRSGKARALLDERDKLAALRAASLVSHLAVPRFCAGDNQSLNDLRIVSPLLLFAAPSREISSQATKSSRPLASKDSRNFG